MTSRKAIHLKRSYLEQIDTHANRARALAIVASLKTKLVKENVKGFLITLAMKLDKGKTLTEADTTISNNYFETRRADIEVLRDLSRSLNT